MKMRSLSKKKNFKIEPFKHKVEVNPKYAEWTWKILDDAIHKICNHNARGLSFEELYRKIFYFVYAQRGFNSWGDLRLVNSSSPATRLVLSCPHSLKALTRLCGIESQDTVRLNVSVDPDLGTVYSMSVPVQRVRPEFQDNGEDVRDDELREVTTSELEEKFDFSEVQDVQGLGQWAQ